MRIGIVVDNELNNDKRVLREAEILRMAGYEVSVLCFGFDGKSYDTIRGLIVKRIYIRKKLKDILFFLINFIPVYEWLWASWIKSFISVNKTDIIHAHDLYMSRSSASGIRKSGRNVKLILDLHENFAFQISTYNWTKGFLRSLLSRPERWEKKEKEYLEYADRIVVLSDEFRDHLVSKYPFLKKENFCSLPNVPDVEQMSSFLPDASIIPFKKTRPVLFYFGIVAERRGIFAALEAFERVIKKGHDADFMIIGPVDKKDSSRFNGTISSEAVAERILYVPWIDLRSLPSYLDFSDICIAPFIKNPQHESGVANKIFDYMLGKKPIIASDCKPQKTLIERYNCGIIYSNENELDEALIRLISSEETRSEMGHNGYTAVINDLNTERIKDALIGLYSGFKNELTVNQY